MAPVRLLLVLLHAGALSTGVARAECEQVRVEAAPALVAAWPELPAKVAEALALRPAVDRCAAVRLTLVDREIHIDVTLPDGRAAARTVRSNDDVVPVLEGLLLVPQPEPETPPQRVDTEAPAPARRPATSAQRADPRLEPAPQPLGEPGQSRVGFELSAITGLRGGDGPTSGSLGAVASLRAWDWLLSFDGRAHTSQAASTLEAALTLGHRFSPGPLELDVLFGVVTELPGSEPGANTRLAGGAEPRPDREPWVTFASRLHLLPRSVIDPFIGGEVLAGVIGPEDVGPVELQGEDVWMAGVVAGAAVRTP